MQVLGTTALLVSSLTVLILLAFSDVLVVPTQNAKPRRKDSSTPPLWEASAELVAHPVGGLPSWLRCYMPRVAHRGVLPDLVACRKWVAPLHLPCKLQAGAGPAHTV